MAGHITMPGAVFYVLFGVFPFVAVAVLIGIGFAMSWTLCCDRAVTVLLPCASFAICDVVATFRRVFFCLVVQASPLGQDRTVYNQ